MGTCFDKPRLNAPGVARRTLRGPKVLLVLMAIWTVGIAIVAVNVGDHLGDVWGLIIGIVIGRLVLSRMRRASLRSR